MTTHGLAYALEGAVLVQGPARGLSNLMTHATAGVSVASGRLLVIHTRSDA